MCQIMREDCKRSTHSSSTIARKNLFRATTAIRHRLTSDRLLPKHLKASIEMRIRAVLFGAGHYSLSVVGGMIYESFTGVFSSFNYEYILYCPTGQDTRGSSVVHYLPMERARFMCQECDMSKIEVFI
uniref:Uncharacterized protein n=1 Tax=Glossina pallidipes TaxID=7398 RepID=A0A1A9ZAJ1_GLOPL